MELQIINTETKNSSVQTKEKTTELQLAYTDLNYPPVKLIEPTTGLALLSTCRRI
jgi:hypothetical protein